MSEECLLDWVSFLLSIHDLGKFADGFQGLRPDVLLALQGRETRVSYTHRHDSLGYLLGDSQLPQRLASTSTEEDLRDLVRPWLSAVTGHHGHPPHTGSLLSGASELLRTQFPQSVRAAASEYIDEAIQLMLPTGCPVRVDDYDVCLPAFRRLSWQAAGLAVAADWIGSNQEWFPYCPTSMALADYWALSATKAERAVCSSGMMPAQVRPWQGLGALFPHLHIPTPLQEYVQNVALGPGPTLFVVEEVTGGGKTEAALALSHRLMERGRASGVFLALPTMATANAMHARVRSMYLRLYEDEASPSLVLAHSHSRMVLNLESENQRDEGYNREHRSASQECAGWLSDSRKKSLLAHVGVGTVDQALLSVLPMVTRRACPRMVGQVSPQCA